MKMFVSFKNSRTFAPTQTKSFNATLSVLATFNGNTATTSVVANDIGYQFPAVCYAVKFANTLGRVERDSLFSFSKLTFNFCSQMTKSTKIANFTNNSSGDYTPCSAKTAHTSLLEILPKVEHIGMDLEGKIYNLTQTKNHLLDLFNEVMDKLPESRVKDSLYSILWQIQTIDDCIASCLTADDFTNLDNLIFYSKELLTSKII